MYTFDMIYKNIMHAHINYVYVMQSYITLLNQLLILFYLICSFPCCNWLTFKTSSIYSYRLVTVRLWRWNDDSLEECKHNNHLDIQNIKLTSQKAYILTFGILAW